MDHILIDDIIYTVEEAQNIAMEFGPCPETVDELLDVLSECLMTDVRLEVSE